MQDVRRLFNGASDVVGNHEDPHAVLFSKGADEFVELRLDGWIKPSDGFVQKKKMFGCAQSARQQCPLALPA